MQNRLKLKRIIEYGVFHDNLNKEKSILGINNLKLSNNLFEIRNKSFISDKFESFIDYKLIKAIHKINEPSLLLCSGGVDSSLIAIFLKKEKKNYFCYHSYYPGQKKNDLNKLKTLKKFVNFNEKIFYIKSNEYIDGMKHAWSKKYFGNTYAPTLYYMFKHKLQNKYKYLITGSGPDELFYGMEKYNLRKFFSLSNMKIEKALEILDVKYNYEKYKLVLNKKGKNLLTEVIFDRSKFYKKIARISKDIFNAQRILAYCTVTNQHVEMYDKLAKSKNLKHIAPFMDKEILSYVLSFDIKNFINFKNQMKDSNAGKVNLKNILQKHTSRSHSFSNKVGFYSPVSSFLYEKTFKKNFYKDLNFEILEEIFSIDKLNKMITSNINDKDYFLYSLLNVNQILKNNQNYL